MNRQSTWVILTLTLGLIGLGNILVTSGNAWTVPGVEEPGAVVPPRFSPLEKPGLPNLYEICPGVYSGGQPEGATGFESLAELGVQRVISVDGARPKLELASRFGLTYVHLPHGYDGVPAGLVARLAKAVQSAGSSVYLHCHNGRHRSPAAAAVACVGLDRISARQARCFLEQVGTSPEYHGLYRSVDEAVPLSQGTLDKTSDQFPTLAPPTPLVASMVQIEQHLATLQRLVERGGRPAPDEPDLDLGHQALLLTEQFAELLRRETTPRSEYGKLMAQAVDRTEQFHHWLSNRQGEFLPAEEVERRVSLIRENCQACHRSFRD